LQGRAELAGFDAVAPDVTGDRTMDRGFPSMTALLGLLAVAGFQNRDKLAELLGGNASRPTTGPGQGIPAAQNDASEPALDGLLGGLAGAGGLGGLLSGGIGELVERFRQAGHGETAQSWVSPGPNKSVAPHELSQAIGADTLDHLSRQTGLPQEEILARLSRTLPEAIDRYTPEGRLPDASAGI
jgi:uncharacterized protein YidB (DUF937 family)